MLRKFLPREVKFYDLFRQSSQELSAASQEFKLLLKQPSEAAKYAAIISDRVKRVDVITHKTVSLLHETFITPIDRQDIHLLVVKLNDVIGLLHAASQRMKLFEVTVVPPELIALSEVCGEMVEGLNDIVNHLEDLKHPAHILETCARLYTLENDADDHLRAGLAKIFREETDFKSLLKIKELLELVETATDRCKDVADVIEGIVLEYA